MTFSSWCRWALLVLAAQVVTVAVFGPLGWQALAPNLVLVVVAVAGLRHGAGAAMVLGFAAGLLLDLAPPAEHTAGRWALALVAVGYLAGRLRPVADPLMDRPRLTSGLLMVAVGAGSFVGTSVYALSGLVLSETVFGVTDLLPAVGLGAAADVLAALAGLALLRLAAWALVRRRVLVRPTPERVTT